MKKIIAASFIAAILSSCALNNTAGIEPNKNPIITQSNFPETRRASLFEEINNIAVTCTYELSKNNSSATDKQKISDFVKKEIRPELSNHNNLFYINIKQICDNKETAVNLQMSSQNYYIIGINGENLPKHVVDYNNRLSLDINRNNFDKIVSETSLQKFNKFPTRESAKTYAEKKELLIQQRTLKMYAFVFAEAARFESIENAVKNAIDGKCRAEWHDFDFTVHNWKNLSTFVTAENDLKEFQIKGGGTNQLIAPITQDQESTFDSSLMNGGKYDFSPEAPLLNPPNYECPLTMNNI